MGEKLFLPCLLYIMNLFLNLGSCLPLKFGFYKSMFALGKWHLHKFLSIQSLEQELKSDFWHCTSLLYYLHSVVSSAGRCQDCQQLWWKYRLPFLTPQVSEPGILRHSLRKFPHCSDAICLGVALVELVPKMISLAPMSMISSTLLKSEYPQPSVCRSENAGLFPEKILPKVAK